MKVSLLLPVHNLQDRLHRVLNGFFSQGLPEDWELIVWDDASTDRTPEILEEFNSRPRYHYHCNDTNLGRAKTRNLLVERARGQWLLFVDGDCRPGPYFYRAWELTIENYPEQKVFFGQVRYEHSKPSGFNRFLDLGSGADKLGEGVIPHRYFTSAHFLMHKSVFEKVGGFSEQFIGWGGEDYDLGARLGTLGLSIRYIRQTHVKHPDIKDLNEYLDRLAEFGDKNLGKLIELYPEEDPFHLSLLKKNSVQLMLGFPGFLAILQRLLVQFDRTLWPFLMYRVLFLGTYGKAYLKTKK